MTHFPPLRPAALGLVFLMTTAVASFAMSDRHLSDRQLSDRQFLNYAIKGDNSEVMLGRLAETRGGTPAVKSFGKTLEGDHARARIQAVRLADLRGMTSPRAPTNQAVAERNKLKGLGPAAFDKEFASFMINEHEKTIAAFRSEAKSAKGPVARLARMSIPTLEKHLRIAERIAKMRTR